MMVANNKSSVADHGLATPPPQPKQFTDEELKQQYGIHMATRLQADENSKESKWADIDDDEDDWAPETVEWIDGTKSMLVPTENQPTPVEESTPTVNPEMLKDASKPADASAQRSAVTSAAKTILKPGGGNQQKGGLVLKGIPEAKPSLVAKPTAPTPQKSPWAQLPPVDKVSPVQINPQPPPQPQPQRFQQTNAHGFDSMPRQPSPAREIAADDFDRSWRDNDRGHRELFDSKSGRYEPVPEGRRGSVRHEQASRQPALLQRPSQPGQAPPAEPSPAFQTSRSSTQADGISWGRRRTSSTVSGGSGQIGRRMSVSRPQDFPPAIDDARASPSISGSENVGAGRQRIGAGQWAHHQSPAIEKAQLSAAPVPIVSPADDKTLQTTIPVSPDGEDVAELQKRVMREKRELARKRREEEEARLEAEKRERLRQKLESLGPMPEKKKSQEKAQTQPQSQPQNSGVESSESAIVMEPEKTTIATPSTIATSPPKPPLPASSGEITQYGSIKLHPPQPFIKSTSHDEKLSQKPSPENTSQPHLPPTIQQLSPSIQQHSPSAPLPPGTVSGASPSNFSEHHFQPPASQDLSRRHQLVDFDKSRFAQPPPRERHQVPWTPSQPIRTNHTPWSPSNMSTVVTRSEVWGAPAQGRALGNGTFDNGYHARPFSQFPTNNQQHGPGPIGPPTRVSPPTSGLPVSQAFEQKPNALHTGSQPPTPAQSNGAAKQPTSTHAPGPIARPKALEHYPSGDDDEEFPYLPDEVLSKMYFLEREKYESALNRFERRRAMKNGTLTIRPAIKETFIQIKSDGTKTGVSVTTERAAVKSGAATAPAPAQQNGANVPAQQGGLRMHREVSPPPEVSTAPPAFTGQRARPLPGLPPTVNMPASPPMHAEQTLQQIPQQQLVGNVRTSRFFPAMSLDDSPPPDSTDHPAHDGDVKKPRVNLPMTIVVKLPPTQAPEPAPVKEQTSSTVQMPVHMPAGAVPLVNTTVWQDRINELCGRKQTTNTSPPQPPSVAALDASTKEPLNDHAQNLAVSVSLPGAESTTVTTDGNAAATSKAAVDDLLEEREFGSLPTVQIPKPTGVAQAEDSKPMTLLNTWPNTKVHQPRAVVAETITASHGWKTFEREEFDPEYGWVLYVKLPGARNAMAMVVKDGKAKYLHAINEPNTPLIPKETPSPQTLARVGANKGSPKTSDAQKKSRWAKPAKRPSRN